MAVKYEGFLKETLSKLYGMDEQRINWLIEQIMNDPKQRFDDPYSDAVKDYFNKASGQDLSENLKHWEKELGIKHTESELPWKKSDQKAKADAGKPRVSLVPSEIIYNIARIREYGNAKYPEGGKDNWKRVDTERYRDAAYRHLLAYIDDPHGLDAESGYPHLWHLACNVAFLCELEKGAFGKEEDISYMD